MIYITGDCHGDFGKLSPSNFPEMHDLTKDDYLIICGDFGGIWNPDGMTTLENMWLDTLGRLPFTLLFVDGNHENFDRLNAFPVEEWHGGKVHKLRPSVIHLMRGEIFDIDGKTVFAFGGAASHDIEGLATVRELNENYAAGIIDTDKPGWEDLAYRCRLCRKRYRVKNYSWWAEEMPSKEEMEHARKNLLAHNNKVDIIITHCCSDTIQKKVEIALRARRWAYDDATSFLEEIYSNVDYKKWYFGHYHADFDVTDKDTILYHEILKYTEE